MARDSRFGTRCCRLTGLRGWGDCMEAHMDHAWLMMRFHAPGEMLVHSGELGAVEMGATATTTMPSRPSARVPRARREMGWGGRAKRKGRAPLSLVSPPTPPLSKWQIG